MSCAVTFFASMLAFAPPASLEESPSSREPDALPVVTTRKGKPVAPPRFEPWLAASSKLMFRSLTLDQGGSVERDRDLLWKPAGLWLGAQGYYRKGSSWATGGLRGDLALGVELLTRTGSAALGLQHTTGYEWRVRPRFNVFLGGRVTFAVDPMHVEQSHVELGAPLGMSWRRVELQWVPAITLPLAQDRREVFDGELRRRVAVHYMPINFVVAVKLGRHAP